MAHRDYDLLGPDGRRAVETGLAAAEWYHTEVPRKVMKDLMERSDQPAIRDTVILYGLMIVFASGSASRSGRRGGRHRSGWLTACFTARPRTAAGMNAATARPSRRRG